VVTLADLPSRLHVTNPQGQLEELEADCLEASANASTVARREAELIEMKLVLDGSGTFFEAARRDAQAEQLMQTAASYALPEVHSTPLLEAAFPPVSDLGMPFVVVVSKGLAGWVC